VAGPGWNGQFARAIAQDADIQYVIPKEGSALFLDSLAIPRGAPHPELRTRSSTT
jgi:spermidine/putrescine transport system substrate-binding protein